MKKSQFQEAQTFLATVEGKKLLYGKKSPDMDLYDFGFGEYVEYANAIGKITMKPKYVLHPSCRFKVFWREKKIFDEFDEHTTSKDFELYIEKLIGSTVQRAVILRENELIIDFGCCYLRFYCHKNGIESWRYFIIKGTHLVASDRWLELER